jgi:hypothetical protein
MIFAQIDLALMNLILPLALAVVGAYVGAIKGNGDLKATIVKELASVASRLDSLEGWLREVAAGETAPFATMRERLDVQRTHMENHEHRLVVIEREMTRLTTEHHRNHECS